LEKKKRMQGRRPAGEASRQNPKIFLNRREEKSESKNQRKCVWKEKKSKRQKRGKKIFKPVKKEEGKGKSFLGSREEKIDIEGGRGEV